jgi:hypothetical protein
VLFAIDQYRAEAAQFNRDTDAGWDPGPSRRAAIRCDRARPAVQPHQRIRSSAGVGLRLYAAGQLLDAAH